jgi:hypothetical protein
MTDNIVQHANTDRGYVFAQYYPKKEHMDIVVADLGVTVKGGYSSVGKNFKTDREALETALQGVSRKIEENSRGYGIYCTRRIVEEGLNGNTFYMVSGNAFSNVIRQKVADLPDELSWPGTLLLIRLPKRPLGFKLSDYYE